MTSTEKCTQGRGTEVAKGPELAPLERDILLHTLGLNYERRPDRNYYCAHVAAESDTLQALRRLVDLGLMREGRLINEGADRLYHATEDGRTHARSLLPPPRKLTRSQARYQRYLQVGDVYTFREFLALEAAQRRVDV